ncbi:hypothetical protein PR048_029395 [Dryococelus australis]|uniref:Uncharacterized protein n=1 Tax=Dryococelus australis TaxID=614101 RepID=A0ABQ9GG45_9NEOP|nr:hypothetical protein PR048_029395 [Dryococelus australis]
MLDCSRYPALFIASFRVAMAPNCLLNCGKRDASSRTPASFLCRGTACARRRGTYRWITEYRPHDLKQLWANMTRRKTSGVRLTLLPDSAKARIQERDSPMSQSLVTTYSQLDRGGDEHPNRQQLEARQFCDIHWLYGLIFPRPGVFCAALEEEEEVHEQCVETRPRRVALEDSRTAPFYGAPVLAASSSPSTRKRYAGSYCHTLYRDSYYRDRYNHRVNASLPCLRRAEIGSFRRRLMGIEAFHLGFSIFLATPSVSEDLSIWRTTNDRNEIPRERRRNTSTAPANAREVDTHPTPANSLDLPLKFTAGLGASQAAKGLASHRYTRQDRRTRGAAVAERLDCSLHTTANRVQSPVRPLPDFRTILLVCEFSRGFTASPALAFRRCPPSLIPPSSALKTSLLRAEPFGSAGSRGRDARMHRSAAFIYVRIKLSPYITESHSWARDQNVREWTLRRYSYSRAPAANLVRRFIYARHNTREIEGFDVRAERKKKTHIRALALCNFGSREEIYRPLPRRLPLLEERRIGTGGERRGDEEVSSGCGSTVAERLACSPPTKATPGRVTGFSQVGIVPDDAVGQRVFSGISHFPRPFISAPLHIHFNHPHRLLRPRF